MKVCVLASGSKGNSTYVESNGTRILIDVGISKKRLLEALDKNNIDNTRIDAILITHEHIDHVSGLQVVLKHFKCKLFLTKLTYEAIKDKYSNFEYSDSVFITNNMSFDVNNIKIGSIPIFHDACDPVGFILEDMGKKIVYITDTGYIHQRYIDDIKDADAYVFECNHDPEILMNSDRPYQTKMRILGNHGHLSNEDALYILGSVVGQNTKKVFYAHISEECNLFEIIDITRKRVFKSMCIDDSNIKFIFTSQCCTKVEEI